MTAPITEQGDQLRFVSYGGGVQSTALLVLAAQGRINFRTFVMANVGDDSEMPATLEYVRHIAAPFAAEHGIDLHMLNRLNRHGDVETLWGRMMKPGSKSLPIPYRLSANAAPVGRACTQNFKTEVTGKWAKANGATKVNPAVVALGISRDEASRASNKRVSDHEIVVYPLIGVGEETGLKLDRSDCANLIRAAGLPVPPKSACFFCPFHRPEVWDELARSEPELFEKACHLEESKTAERVARGLDPIYLTRFGKPLRLVASSAQGSMFSDEELENCDSGWCMT